VIKNKMTGMNNDILEERASSSSVKIDG